ncbi:MAG TPA: hypothetical protein VIF83_07045, partial [Gemmatimonadaceae bacterium]
MSDFALPSPDIRRVGQQLSDAPTRVLFCRADELKPQLQKAGVDLENDYVSLQVILSKFDNIG